MRRRGWSFSGAGGAYEATSPSTTAPRTTHLSPAGGRVGAVSSAARSSRLRWATIPRRNQCRHNEHAYNNRVHGMVIAGSIPVTDPTKPGQWVANMRRAYRGRDDVARPVWQCSLRTAPGDRRLSDAEWADAAQVFAERLGFDQHPWVAVRHADDHIHLALSRVAHDGRVWLGRHDYRTTQDARRELEVELGLVQAPVRRGVSSERTEITQVQPGEYRMFADAGHHPPRAVLAGQVLAAANTAAGRGRAAFEAELTERGIDFAVNQASTGTVSGYRFAAPTTTHADHNGEQVWFKASQLDKKLAWRQLSHVLEPLPQVQGEKEFTRQHTTELTQRAQQARAGRITEQWAQTGNPPVEQVTTTLTEARTHLDTLNTQLTAARATVEQQVREAAGQLADAQHAVYTAGRLGRGRAQHRFDRLAATHSERLGVPVTSPDGRQRDYTAIYDHVLTTHHGELLGDRNHWAQVAATATRQLAVWEKIQQDNPDHGAHGPQAVRLAAIMFQPHSPQQRAYRTYLSELPAPLVYPEGEPDPVGAQLLTHLADPDIVEHRQQRLQQNLEALGDYQHHRTPPPAARTTRRTPQAPGRYTPPPAANRNQDRGRGR